MEVNTWRASSRKYGVAILHYRPQKAGYLRLTVGDAVHIVEEYGSGQTGWFRGYLLSYRNQVGIFPKMFIHTKDFEVENAGQFETVTPKEDPMAQELTLTLREWWVAWKKMYCRKGSTNTLQQIYSVMLDLLLLRAKLLSNMLTGDSMVDLKDEIADIVDWGNGQLGMDLIPRVNGEQVDVDKCSIVRLYRVHLQSAENAKSKQPRYSRKRSKSVATSVSVTAEVFNVLVSFKSTQCNVGDESQIIMNVYDSRDQKFISEQYEIKMNKNGFPARPEKLDNSYGIFTELPFNEDPKFLYIVVRIYRIGRMFVDGNKKSPTRPYRRPFGVGVLSIEEVKNRTNRGESSLFTVNISCSENEGSFPDLHKDLIKKSTNPGFTSGIGTSLGSSKSGSTPTKLGSVACNSLKLDVSIHDGDLQAVKTEKPMLFHNNITVVPKLSQFDIINPGEVRNDIYLTLMEATFERGNKKSQKNVEVVVTVFNVNGKPIQNCITHGCGEDQMTHFASSVYYHDNNPKWQETIKISLPMDELPGCHIRFDVYHCQARNRAEKRLYGFGFMRVTNDLQIVIKDGSHSLCIFKCEDEKKIKFEKYYLLHFLLDDYGDTSKQFVQSPTAMPYERHQREHIEVRTLLCSTKFTQTTELLGVLNWKEERENLDQNLEKLMTVQGTEIMKFLQNIMDRLLEILDDACSSQKTYCSKVFQVVVFILNLLLDSRYENFRPVYEDYLVKSFSFPNVYKHLISQFSSGIVEFCEGRPFTLSMAMKVIGELMRLITRSRQLELASPFYQRESELEFKKQLHDLFQKMGMLLTRQDEKPKISQMELLSNLHKCYEPLMELITKRELADEVRDVITQLPKAKDLAVGIRSSKMKFIQNTVNSDLFKDDESRSTLLSLCLNHIKACLIERHFLDIATSVLGDILEILFSLTEVKSITQDINTLALSLFEVLIQSISQMADGEFVAQTNYPQVMLRKPTLSNSSPSSTLDRKSRHSRAMFLGASRPISEICQYKEESSKNLGEMVSCLTEFLRLMEETHYTAVIQMYPKGPPLKDFLTQVLHTFQELIKPDMLSSDWTIMRMETNNVIFSAVEYFSQALKNDFLEGEYFDQHLWNLYFNLAVEFIVQPSLQLEEYSETKRNKFLERYHDMRVMMGHQIQTLWEKLGTNRRHFIPSMIGPFLKVTLVPQRELRVATLPIFYDMIHCEQRTSGNFVMVEKEIIEKLDMFITMENQGDNEYKQLFNSILLERVQSEPALKDTGSQFIVSVTNLLEKLLDFRQVNDGEGNRDRMQCTFNILNFYRDNKDKRREMYTQYIKKLYDLHCSSRNYVEAGLTLQLYVQLLEWKNDTVHSEMGFPPEPQCERKEKLLLEIIECFDKGKLWEYGIPVCKDLASYYESRLMYRKLSRILQREASFFTKILDGVEVPSESSQEPKFYPRQQPTYFRVAYYGLSFPPFVQNKAFIYRGDECLKLQDIINQLTQEFPEAHILKSNNPVEEHKKNEQTQYIQISSVKPVPDHKHLFSAGQSVPKEVEKFYENNNVDTFRLDRSYHEGRKDPDNEFITLCTERTTMKTNHKFPGILQWYEVVESERTTFSPVATAINAVSSACRELETSVDTCRRSCSDNNMKDLSRQLNGMIQAQVQGGIPKYQEAFFTEVYKAAYPEECGNIQKLMEVINLQISLLDQGMSVMKKDNSDHYAPLIQSLDEELRKLMKKVGYRRERKPNHKELKKWDSGMGSFIDPRPGTPNSQHSSGSNRSSIVSSDSRSNEQEDLINLVPTNESPATSKPRSVSPSGNPKQRSVSPSSKGGFVADLPDISKARGKSVYIKSPGSRPPVPKRNRSEPFPPNDPVSRQIPSPKAGGIPEEEDSNPVSSGKPQLPKKISISKLLTSDKDNDGFSITNTVVPPLPPRRSMMIKTDLNLNRDASNIKSPSPRGSRLSNFSEDMEVSSNTNSEPPPIPSHTMPRLPTIPGGRKLSDSENNFNGPFVNSAPMNHNVHLHNGKVPSLPTSRTSIIGDKLSHDSNDKAPENEPPPIPSRPKRLSNSSDTSSNSSPHPEIPKRLSNTSQVSLASSSSSHGHPDSESSNL